MKKILEHVLKRLFTAVTAMLAGFGFTPDEAHTILAALIVFVGVVADVVLERRMANG